MKNLFFYGTLRHIPLLELVMGRSAEQLGITAASLLDFVVSAVAEGPFPMIEHSAGQEAVGILVSGLTSEDLARLDFYEGSFDYDLQPVTLMGGQAAEVYVPRPGRWTNAGPWDLAQWAQDHGALSVTAAQEVMSYMGSRSRAEVDIMFDMIRARAASHLRAGESQHGRDSFRGSVQVLDQERRYSEFFALDEITLRHAHFDGSLSEPLDRAVFVAVDAALVLPYDPVRDRVLLVEQVRMGPVVRGDRTMWQLEPIAGRIDAGELPQDAARREAREEAGLEIGALETIAEVYPSPGTSTEFYYVYLGLCDLPDSAEGIGGLPSEGENIRARVLAFDDLMARVQSLDVANAPLTMAAYYLSHHRDRLRSGGAVVTPT
ncbi:NUDIX domain-containing protein [Sulfitobacter noctilucae]|uniref:NUDIX domain-containing protein n=1 Tax=Sulfitobacter noctilucae TaxID=1342302 RepID=UPI0004692D67|nr:NUDIX domain-containing protein [Sulfitobacter noctilucae]